MKCSGSTLLSKMLKILSSLLLIFSATIAALNLYQAKDAAGRSDQVLQELSPAIGALVQERIAGADNIMNVPDYILNPEIEMPSICIDGNDYIGILDIPALELSLPVMSQWSYDNLKTAPCRYSGTVYKNNLVIAAHNYARHFGKLPSLAYGDDIYFTDTEGNVFHYVVSELETLQPHAVDYMESNNPGLSLFTCTIGGEKRLTIRALTSE